MIINNKLFMDILQKKLELSDKIYFIHSLYVFKK